MYTTSNSSPLALWKVIRFKWPGEPPCPANCVTDQPANFLVGSHRPKIDASFEASSASIGSLSNNPRRQQSSNIFSQSRRLSPVSRWEKRKRTSSRLRSRFSLSLPTDPLKDRQRARRSDSAGSPVRQPPAHQ